MVASSSAALLGVPSQDRFVLFACGLVWLTVAAVHRRVRSTLAVSVLVGSSAVAIALNAFYTGGIDSPVCIWLAVLPLSGGLLAGRRGMVSGMVCLALALVFILWTTSAGLTHSIVLPAGNFLMIRLGNLLGLSVLLGVAMLLSDRLSTQVTGTMLASNIRLQVEVDDHEATRRKLEELYSELVDIARQAGMGQVATGVLHNVGNALNGVTTSVALAMSEVNRASPALERVAALMEQPELTVEKRETVAAYLRRLDVSYAERLGRVQQELECIRNASEHMASVVTAQQELATTSGMVERVPVRQIVGQAHLLLNTSLIRHHIEWVLDVPPDLIATLDRHRAVQILTNLLANGRDAMRDVTGERRLVVRATGQEGWIAIQVTDTGSGVSQALAERVFEHGFTTKADGHGFGLHSSALAATEMGGRLSLKAADRGAHFVLSVPDLAWNQAPAVGRDSVAKASA